MGIDAERFLPRQCFASERSERSDNEASLRDPRYRRCGGLGAGADTARRRPRRWWRSRRRRDDVRLCPGDLRQYRLPARVQQPGTADGLERRLDPAGLEPRPQNRLAPRDNAAGPRSPHDVADQFADAFALAALKPASVRLCTRPFEAGQSFALIAGCLCCGFGGGPPLYPRSDPGFAIASLTLTRPPC